MTHRWKPFIFQTLGIRAVLSPLPCKKQNPKAKDPAGMVTHTIPTGSFSFFLSGSGIQQTEKEPWE